PKVLPISERSKQLRKLEFVSIILEGQVWEQSLVLFTQLATLPNSWILFLGSPILMCYYRIKFQEVPCRFMKNVILRPILEHCLSITLKCHFLPHSPRDKICITY